MPSADDRERGESGERSDAEEWQLLMEFVTSEQHGGVGNKAEQAVGFLQKDSP